ncbi:hypothetical protein PIB30_007358 [Stylosanthes scabra]|uniref:Uncharacterized protein n=1 Tax=Stylosanthes scabra TaxID=79078 RepID=A0ABU6Y2Q8_9FABA|nr:hypothetical protein [Stylosanthes scabra]
MDEQQPPHRFECVYFPKAKFNTMPHMHIRLANFHPRVQCAAMDLLLKLNRSNTKPSAFTGTGCVKCLRRRRSDKRAEGSSGGLICVWEKAFLEAENWGEVTWVGPHDLGTGLNCGCVKK